MRTTVGNNLIIELGQTRAIGFPWLVRVYKKVLGIKRRVSSDWFLDEEQARNYMEQLVADLRSNASTGTLKDRKPGWTLHG